MPLEEHIARQSLKRPQQSTVRPQRVKLSNTVGAAPIRAEAFEYKQIPSRYGSALRLPDGTEV